MTHSPIPEDLRRFILTSIPSVPFLEAMLLLRADPTQQWESALLASRLYIRERVASQVLADLCTAGIARPCDPPASHCHRYDPASQALRDRIDRLADLYARRLVDVTHLIHSSLERQAQQFADAFRLRKDE